MKRRFVFISMLLMGMAVGFTSCEEEPEDTCDGTENIQDDFQCEKPVIPQICTVDGVDDHWILDGVEYACPENDCTIPPADMIAAMQESYGCAGTKSAEFIIAKQKLTEQATVILERLRAESTLCRN